MNVSVSHEVGIDDIHSRGIPMALFATAALGGNGLGPLISGWTEMNEKLEWRWIQWIYMMSVSLHLVQVYWLISS